MWITRVGRWFVERFKDLFYDATNGHLDNGRFIAFATMASIIGAAVWNMHIGKEINLADFGNGLSLVLTALVIYVYHDRKQNAS